MIKIFHTLTIVAFSVSSLFASDFSKFQTLNVQDLIKNQNIEFVIPSPIKPSEIKNPGFEKFNYTGIPNCIFTEETDITPIIVNAINSANYTLDIALYNLKLSDITQSIMDAQDRGVQVRIIFDYGHVVPRTGRDLKILIDRGMNIKLMRGRLRSGSMHNKYAIFDGAALQMGSANWTSTAEKSNYENMMFVYDPEIIRGYQANFEWMWDQAISAYDLNANPPPPGPLPYDPNPSVSFNGQVFPKYIFSPRGGTTDMIVRAIDSAQMEIDVAMFSMTSKPIMEALIRAKARGINIKLMLSAGMKFPFYHQALKNKMTLKFMDGRIYRGRMHNKFTIIDNTLLINGAFNFSANAEKVNAENTIITTSSTYVSPFKRVFEKLFLQAKPVGQY
ncbi:MAG: phospholipase D-like domain-containing protein [Elusimicrobiota bacterium]|nr:phospholipase D-like domain-containing protein [Elusimicrobiota bacterium]